MLRQLLKFARQNLRLSPNRKPQKRGLRIKKTKGGKHKPEGLIPKDTQIAFQRSKVSS
jgi:hypothetical protein